MRRRLRPAHSPEVLADLYAAPHDHHRWADHISRIAATIEQARRIGPVDSAADLSCGSGAILQAVDAQRRVFGDLAPGRELTGPIEKTVEDLDPVDLLICTETLEHLDDPDKALQQFRAKARMLLLSTPVDNWADRNPEHYWAWDRSEVEQMLDAAGWTVDEYSCADFTACGPQFYRFGIWTCR